MARGRALQHVVPSHVPLFTLQSVKIKYNLTSRFSATLATFQRHDGRIGRVTHMLDGECGLRDNAGDIGCVCGGVGWESHNLGSELSDTISSPCDL